MKTLNKAIRSAMMPLFLGVMFVNATIVFTGAILTIAAKKAARVIR